MLTGAWDKGRKGNWGYCILMEGETEGQREGQAECGCQGLTPVEGSAKLKGCWWALGGGGVLWPAERSFQVLATWRTGNMLFSSGMPQEQHRAEVDGTWDWALEFVLGHPFSPFIMVTVGGAVGGQEDIFPDLCYKWEFLSSMARPQHLVKMPGNNTQHSGGPRLLFLASAEPT